MVSKRREEGEEEEEEEEASKYASFSLMESKLSHPRHRQSEQTGPTDDRQCKIGAETRHNLPSDD